MRVNPFNTNCKPCGLDCAPIGGRGPRFGQTSAAAQAAKIVGPDVTMFLINNAAQLKKGAFRHLEGKKGNQTGPQELLEFGRKFYKKLKGK